ncbi:pyridoxamine 5'-phosphate oxidase family protein [Accumulibacter sp.]|uniref:pyridoxamine 5'-phosphate oxidase family protein n=1 Tax=Accumulibacter sp. TaxID=2053492 RepID=UPI0028C3F4B5|nr:pyridoxamine 5'-phosphate oxidase family protein [Accumulibacter sp.]
MQEIEDNSPFHAAERAAQRLAGVDDRILAVGRSAIRDHLLAQHQEFFRSQHQLLLATVDADAQPWVAMVAGPPGFAHALDARHLRVDAQPLAGAPGQALSAGATLGVLGINFANRRRNRLNGRLLTVDESGFELEVVQSFGNCPKYIQTRETRLPAGTTWRVSPSAGEAVTAWDDNACALIGGADHFFIATHYDQEGDQAHHGADVSHRGGKPGFIRIDADGTLLFPDFAGNRFYNTLGNIVANGKAALLFTDYSTGSLLSTSGMASVDWQAASAHGFAGAERLLRFTPREVWRYPRALPFAWRFGEQSVALDATGRWSDSVTPPG